MGWDMKGDTVPRARCQERYVRKRTAHIICITTLCSEKKLFVNYQMHKGMYPWLRTNLEKDMKNWRAKI